MARRAATEVLMLTSRYAPTMGRLELAGVNIVRGVVGAKPLEPVR